VLQEVQHVAEVAAADVVMRESDGVVHVDDHMPVAVWDENRLTLFHDTLQGPS
jgi:hypothetical protein